MTYALSRGKKTTRKIEVKAEELGDFDEKLGILKFNAEFKITPAKAWTSDIEDFSTEELVRNKLVNITGVNNEDGTPAEYNPALVDALLTEQWILNALLQALLVVQGGGKQAEWHKNLKLKN